MNEYLYKQDNAKQSYHPPLKRSAVCEAEMVYTLIILQTYWKYTFKVYLKYTSLILEVYLKSTYRIKEEEVYFKSVLF